MKKRLTWKGAVAAAGLALITMLAPAGAQTDVPAKRGDSQEPVVDTYNKQPDPSGKNQDFDAATYEKAPDPQGEDRPSPAPEQTKRGDSQKPPLDTYDDVPEAQSSVEKPSQNDVSDLEKPRLGDEQKPVVPSYDKRPDPKGESQKFDAVRYEQDNDANDGLPAELQMKVLEGSVKE
jgi:hypothetical protein